MVSSFDHLNQEWLLKFLEQRIGDKRVWRLVWRILKSGVMEDGLERASEEGTPQGGSLSALLSNVYLHYVLDLWTHRWRRSARGTVMIVRYADDFVLGFEDRAEAERYRRDLQQRLQQFGLQLHPEKTRLIEFGRRAVERRQQQGLKRPDTFTFLGFRHL